MWDNSAVSLFPKVSLHGLADEGGPGPDHDQRSFVTAHTGVSVPHSPFPSPLPALFVLCQSESRPLVPPICFIYLTYVKRTLYTTIEHSILRRPGVLPACVRNNVIKRIDTCI